MNRLYEFLRRHPTGVDGFLVFVVVLTSLVAMDQALHITSWAARWSAGCVVVSMCVALVLRRRWPERMLLVTVASLLFQLAADVPPLPANSVYFFVVFTAALAARRWVSRLTLAGSLVVPTLFSLRWPGHLTRTDGIWELIASAFMATVTVSMAWALGDRQRTRRAYYTELEERAVRLEQERETQARMAVANERARIARELNDVVAHNVSVMVVQADGAAYILDRAPDQARAALQTISTTGRQALAEMRRLLDVLRSEDAAAAPPDYRPQPGVDQLCDLVDQVRGAGLPVDFRIEGSPRPLPTGVELTAYRIVQEALANTRKHAGPDVGATVRLAYCGDALTVLAEDNGGGAFRGGCPAGRDADGWGHGLIGMRERVGLVGGDLFAGPRPGGGFRIRATLPLHDEGREVETAPADGDRHDEQRSRRC